MYDIDNPMIKDGPGAPWNQPSEDGRDADEAAQRTLSALNASDTSLEIGEYGDEDKALATVLALAAGDRDDAVIAAAARRLVHQAVENRNPDYWRRVDERAQALAMSEWRRTNDLARMAAGLSIRSKA